MSILMQSSVAVILLLLVFLWIYGNYQNQKYRQCWLDSSNLLHNLASDLGVINWEVSVYYASADHFKSFWKNGQLLFEGHGLLCQLETTIVFVGYLRNSLHIERMLTKLDPDRKKIIHCDQNYTFLRYIFDPENIDLAWIGQSQFWLNGAWSWFTLSELEDRHYFTAYDGKRTVFGSQTATKKIYHRLTKFLKSS